MSELKKYNSFFENFIPAWSLQGNPEVGGYSSHFEEVSKKLTHLKIFRSAKRVSRESSSCSNPKQALQIKQRREDFFKIGEKPIFIIEAEDLEKDAKEITEKYLSFNLPPTTPPKSREWYEAII